VTRLNLTWTASAAAHVFAVGDYLVRDGRRHYRVAAVVDENTLEIERTWRCVWYDFRVLCEEAWSRLADRFM
jgi:predicted Zn-dependent protease